MPAEAPREAANVIEGIESGTSLFLIDEDTSATNFMVRDELMQRVVADSEEPITPFISRVRICMRSSASRRFSLPEAPVLTSMWQTLSFR